MENKNGKVPLISKVAYGFGAVSYTHLDVYKRQEDYSSALLGITCHSVVCNIKLLYHVCVL